MQVHTVNSNHRATAHNEETSKKIPPSMLKSDTDLYQQQQSEQSGSKTEVEERREHERIKMEKPIPVKVFIAQPFINSYLHLLDISQGGACLAGTTKVYERLSVVNFTIPPLFNDFPESLHLSGVPRWKNQENGLFGIKFDLDRNLQKKLSILLGKFKTTPINADMLTDTPINMQMGPQVWQNTEQAQMQNPVTVPKSPMKQQQVMQEGKLSVSPTEPTNSKHFRRSALPYLGFATVLIAGSALLFAAIGNQIPKVSEAKKVEAAAASRYPFEKLPKTEWRTSEWDPWLALMNPNEYWQGRPIPKKWPADARKALQKWKNENGIK